MALRACRGLIREGGLPNLSLRKIAGAIGYTPGALYQVFDSLDDIVHQANAETLRELLVYCNPANHEVQPDNALRNLAGNFLSFVEENPHSWAAVIEYRYGPEFEFAKNYDDLVQQLLGLILNATAPFYEPDVPVESRVKEARALWCSMYGVSALNSAGRLGKDQTPDSLIACIVEIFVASKT